MAKEVPDLDPIALPQPPTARRVRALAAAELVALAQGRDDALTYGEQAVELGRALGDRSALAFAVWLHGSALAGVFGQHERAIGLLEEAGALLEAVAQRYELKLWGNRPPTLSASSPLQRCFQGEVWGADMYQVLRRSRITAAGS